MDEDPWRAFHGWKRTDGTLWRKLMVRLNNLSESISHFWDHKKPISDFYAAKLVEYDTHAEKVTAISYRQEDQKYILKYDDDWGNNLTFVVQDIRY